ncbi:ABC transporter ATP-binding protein [Halococcus sp. IIIV-5B]|uniref:ABC transporter ATP-binding protein n=1 Tax=Halococcus sp. IIIV-5B TaxID=2321230 RepID=UPI000E760E5A|nr:sn-glycerol-3-phosphate ABC transporter ATP-binding protein UgpC [Halococcus sp. IIIV-5B]RJT06805.1 sn-glycerol-3-phosphate ABC transporter ATP-binding protein UgpC [Halococcus sp. IIIV-5B]
MSKSNDNTETTTWTNRRGNEADAVPQRGDRESAPVTFENVRKVYDNRMVAVADFSARIEGGEFITIVGPSGSGKSTLLRMIAGLESISGGDILVGGESVKGVDPQDRGIAMVFQNYALYPHMSVRKNMSYGLKLTSDLDSEEITRRVEATAEMMGIGDYLDQRPGTLSGGQQQRVATGRAIVRDPALFLMDEPLSNLDAKLKIHMRTELQRIQDDLGTTTIYVTHDQHEALTMSDRIIVLDEGELQQFASPSEVYDQPVNRFVADFIGEPSMNFFDVTLDGHRLFAPGFEYSLGPDVAETVRGRQRDEALELGVRPEDISLSERGDITARVEVVENAGSDNYLYLDVGGSECTVRVSGNVDVTRGAELSISFEPDDIHIFDRATGENISPYIDSKAATTRSTTQ